MKLMQRHRSIFLFLFIDFFFTVSRNWRSRVLFWQKKKKKKMRITVSFKLPSECNRSSGLIDILKIFPLPYSWQTCLRKAGMETPIFVLYSRQPIMLQWWGFNVHTMLFFFRNKVLPTIPQYNIYATNYNVNLAKLI